MPDTQTGGLPKSLIQATVNIFRPGTNGTGFLCPFPLIDDTDTFFLSFLINTYWRGLTRKMLEFD